MPGAIIGLARLNRPSIFIYGGSIMPSEINTDYVSVLERPENLPRETFLKKSLLRLKKSQLKVLVHAEECTQLIPWHQRLRH